MKRVILCVLALLLMCGCAQTQEDPFRVDTVVLIPVDPTEAPTEAATEEPTEAPTEAPVEETELPTETTASKVTTSYKSSSSNKGSSGSKNPSSTSQKPKETEPVWTPPPALSPEEPPYNPSTYVIGELEYAMLQELNAYRLELGLGELAIHERLSGVACLRAQEVSVTHNSIRPDGSDYTTALETYGFQCNGSAELIIYATGEADAAHFAAKWMSSQVHREKICTAEYTTAGIGVYTDAGIVYLVCLLIG